MGLRRRGTQARGALVDEVGGVGYKLNVTEPEGPPASPGGGPTPEQISARLEALLKRTHALRAQQAPVHSGGPLGVTWPPPDRELDRYDVVDVEAAPASALPGHPAPTAPDFARPDWSELRLRSPGDDSSTGLGWTRLLIGLLALVAVAEGAYIWYLQSTRPAMVQGRLLVDEPEGAEVRVDGQAVGVAPLEHILDPGQYDIELVNRGRTLRADRVIIGLGRTVMLLSPDGATLAATPIPASDAAPAGALGPAAARGGPTSAASGAAAPALMTATTGAVAIESTPSGLPITMGGRPRGVTPITLGQIPPGRHDVLVGGAMRRVDVQAGQVTTLRVTR